MDNPEGSKLRSFQTWFKSRFLFTLPMFYGRGMFQYSFGLMPFRRPLTVVVGEPIQTQKWRKSEVTIDKWVMKSLR